MTAYSTWEKYWNGAKCVGEGERFFLPDEKLRRGERIRRESAAKTICRSCPLQKQCLEWALQHNEPYGVWGGYSEDERSQMYAIRSAFGLNRRKSSTKAS